MMDLMGKRNYCFILSGLILVACIIGMIVNGVQLDIQFQGGTILQIEMPDSNFDEVKAEGIVMDTIGKRARAQKSQTYNAETSENDINLLVLNIGSTETLTEDERSKVLDAIFTEYNLPDDSEVTVNSVEPFIGDEIRINSIYAIIWASVLIVLYVWFRFRVMHGLSAGIFAVLALLHDVMVMFTVYVIFMIPLNESFVAAVLTIIGYSINDTVVIYDRIRENSRILKKMPIGELVNRSVVETLNRSINTSVTTLICILTLYIFAAIYNIGPVKEFTLPLSVGILSGCYSTIFIASPLYMIWQQRGEKKKLARKAAKA
jgi:preprotein translocase subunit SecF